MSAIEKEIGLGISNKGQGSRDAAFRKKGVAQNDKKRRLVLSDSDSDEASVSAWKKLESEIGPQQNRGSSAVRKDSGVDGVEEKREVSVEMKQENAMQVKKRVLRSDSLKQRQEAVSDDKDVSTPLLERKKEFRKLFDAGERKEASADTKIFPNGDSFSAVKDRGVENISEEEQELRVEEKELAEAQMLKRMIRSDAVKQQEVHDERDVTQSQSVKKKIREPANSDTREIMKAPSDSEISLNGDSLSIVKDNGLEGIEEEAEVHMTKRIQEPVIEGKAVFCSPLKKKRSREPSDSGTSQDRGVDGTKEEKEVYPEKNREIEVQTKKRILRSDVMKREEIVYDKKDIIQSQTQRKRIREPSDAGILQERTRSSSDTEIPLKNIKTDLSRHREGKTERSQTKKIKKDALGHIDEKEVKKDSSIGSKGVSPTSRERGGMREKQTDLISIKSNMTDEENIKWIERSGNRVLRVLKNKSSSIAGCRKGDTCITQQKGGVLRVQGKSGVLRVLPNNKMDLLENFKAKRRNEEKQKIIRSSGIATRGTLKQPPLSGERKVQEKTSSGVALGKNYAIRKLPVSNKSRSSDQEKEREVLPPERGSKKLDMSNNKTAIKGKNLSNSKAQLLSKQKTIESSTSLRTAKQELRDHIKTILLNAGWKIDLRPRNGRDYLDAVYMPPKGQPGQSTYWSITKAYAAFQEHLKSECAGQGVKSGKSNKSSCGDFNLKVSTSNSIIPLESLNMLKRIIVNKRRSKKELEEAERSKKKKGKKSFGKINSKNQHGKTKADDARQKKRTCDNLDSDENVSVASTGHKHLQTRKNKQKGCTLLARGSNQEAESDNDDYVYYSWKRTVLSWMIDLGVVPINGKAKYMNSKRTKTKLEGRITRDGIHCSCCSKILTISKFELHAGSKLHQASQNIFVEDMGVSLFQCQLNAWEKQDVSERQGFYAIDVTGDDPNDDTCGICGDGGDLICCDGCPSTFHISCLGIQMLPPGDWNCTNCSCRFCGVVSKADAQETGETVSPLLSCFQCEGKYHQGCVPEEDSIPFSPNKSGISFCGRSCRKVFRQLQKFLGTKNDLEAGFSWTLIRRFDDDSSKSPFRPAQRAECNSKIAVALAVMDECFLPIIDQRSGINLIRNVVYNCGSNFSRLNYGGFYTFVLERGDEIISAASVRFHGTKLAEMPFIGTRNMYRRQGMARRLLDGIESALCSLNVEKLIIPAISELKDTWTSVFGFKPLESSEELEFRSINLLVFPGTGLLQKLLLKKDPVECHTSVKAIECDENQHEQTFILAPESSSVIDLTSNVPPEYKSSQNSGNACVHDHFAVPYHDAPVVEDKSQEGCSVEPTIHIVSEAIVNENHELNNADNSTMPNTHDFHVTSLESSADAKCMSQNGFSSTFPAYGASTVTSTDATECKLLKDKFEERCVSADLIAPTQLESARISVLVPACSLVSTLDHAQHSKQSVTSKPCSPCSVESNCQSTAELNKVPNHVVKDEVPCRLSL